MEQQTAEDWLEEGLNTVLTHEQQMQVIGLFQQAKEMDKRQKKRAWDRGKYIGESFPQKQIEPEYEQDAEEYYTQTYGK